MSSAALAAACEAGLPPLGGRPLWLYRLAWAVLAVAAIGIHVALIARPASELAIVALRIGKAAVVFTVAAILLRRRRRDPVAALLSIAFLLWIITSSSDFTSDAVAPQLIDRVRFLLFVLALLLFPDGVWRWRSSRAVAAVSVAVCLLGMGEASGLLATRLFLPLAIGCVLAAVASLVSRFRTAAEAQRQQLKWVAFGLVAGIGLILSARAGAGLAAVSPVVAELPVVWEGLFQVGIAVIALGFLVSLLRYRLFDAETAISRSASYAALTAALVATFAATEALIEWLGEQYLGMAIGNVSAAVGAAVAATLLTPLHERISK